VTVNPRRAAGRGAYLCPSLSCLEDALRRKALPRALRVALPGLDAAALRRRISAEGDRLKSTEIGRGSTGSKESY
jgi:predicted RNA-binding protein YlxR (DUF448 family)